MGLRQQRILEVDEHSSPLLSFQRHGVSSHCFHSPERVLEQWMGINSVGPRSHGKKPLRLRGKPNATPELKGDSYEDHHQLARSRGTAGRHQHRCCPSASHKSADALRGRDACRGLGALTVRPLSKCEGACALAFVPGGMRASRPRGSVVSPQMMRCSPMTNMSPSCATSVASGSGGRARGAVNPYRPAL